MALLVGDQVQGVVGDLKDHPHLPGPIGQCLDDVVVRFGGHRPQPGGGPDQRRRLAGYDLFVFGDAMAKVEIELELAGLPLDQLGVRGGEKPHRFLAEIGGRHFRGASHQKVTGQDRDSVAPVGIDRRRSTSDVRLVDHIVVIEGCRHG